MALNNPAFTRNEAFSEKGTAATATAGLSAAQLQAMYNQPAANAVDTDRMTIDDTIVKSTVSFIVLLIDIAVNFWRARALHRTARHTRSQALEADALHFASDVFGSSAVIIGLALSGLGYQWGDAAAAIGVAVLISVLGLRLHGEF